MTSESQLLAAAGYLAEATERAAQTGEALQAAPQLAVTGPDPVYLVHESGNPGSAGWYPPGVADVLLREGRGWSKAEPPATAEQQVPAEDAAAQVDGGEENDDGTPPADPGKPNRRGAGATKE